MSLNPTTASNYRSNATIQVLGADIHPELPRELYTENGWELTDYCSLALAEDEGIDSSNSNSYLQRITARLIQATHSFVGRDQIHEEEKPDGTVPTNSSSSSSNSSSGYLDAIICASGGWQSDPLPISIPLSKNASIASLQQQQQHYQPQKSPGRDDILANAMAQCATIDAMRRQNLDPVVAAAQLAPYFLHPTRPTLFVVLGATAALQPTPGLMGYGLAKSAAHFVVQTLGAASDNSLELKSVRQAGRAHYRNQGPSGLDRCTVLGILPSMLDTPANRQMARQNANTTNDNNSNEHAQKTLDPKTKKAKLDDLFATWTKPQDIAEQIGAWIQAPALRPHSGALLKVYHSSKKTSTSGRGDDNDRGGGGAVFELVR